RIVDAGAESRDAVADFLRRHSSLAVARRGELVEAPRHPAMLAWADDELVGVTTYVVDGEACELLTLHADTRLTGIGTALVEAVRERALDAGCGLLWVVTTNDNIEALRFYQRRGFRLARLRTGAGDRRRDTLKPEIPAIGDHGIPLRDEIELEMSLAPAGRM